MSSDDAKDTARSSLEEAAAQGQLPGVAEEDAAEERGKDDSRSPDEDAIANDNLGNFVRRLDNE